MVLPSELTQRPRHSLARMMCLIVVIAVDMAALRPFFPLQLDMIDTSYPWSVQREAAFLPPRFPNLGIVLLILVLEIGLFRLALRQGVKRAFWLGFEATGWTCVIICSIFSRTIWLQARPLFEGYVLGRQIGSPPDMGRFVLFVGAIYLTVILAVALFVGMLARSRWHQRLNSRMCQLRC